MLIALCLHWSQFLQAHEKISIAGMVVASPSGYPMTNPFISDREQGVGNCTKLWAELGLTPSSRTRVMEAGGIRLILMSSRSSTLPFPIGTPGVGKNSDEVDHGAPERPPAVAQASRARVRHSRTRSSLDLVKRGGAGSGATARRPAIFVVRADLERKLEAWKVT